MVRFLSLVLSGATLLALSTVAVAVENRGVFNEVAENLWFNHDQLVSNSVVLVGERSVLVVDARMHPDDADALIDEIRSITDLPVQWLVNSQFHGDHFLGNSAFRAIGANIVAQRKTAAAIDRVFDHELKRRAPYFSRLKFSGRPVELTSPDIVFEQRLDLDVGGYVAQVVYIGDGQNPGDTAVVFPAQRAAFTSGAFVNRSWPNTSYTSSMEQWLEALERLLELDVDIYLPPHGPPATRDDIRALIGLLVALQQAVAEGIEQGDSVDKIVAENPFEAYSDWRNYKNRERDIRALYFLMTTGKSQYFEKLD